MFLRGKSACLIHRANIQSVVRQSARIVSSPCRCITREWGANRAVRRELCARGGVYVRYRACGAETRSVAPASGAPLIRRNGDFCSVTPTRIIYSKYLDWFKIFALKKLNLNTILLGNINNTGTIEWKFWTLKRQPALMLRLCSDGSRDFQLSELRLT